MTTRTANRTAVAKKSAKPAEAKTVRLQFTPDAKKPDTKPGETGGALRFTETGEDLLVGSLYMRKEQAVALFGYLPEGVEVTLKPKAAADAS